MPLSALTARRLSYLAALIIVVMLGLLSRRMPLGWWVYDKSLGDVLYATAAYLGLAMLWPGRPIWQLAGIALVCCLAVEFLQLTEFNARLAAWPVIGWFLGTTFSWHDVVCYLVGVIVAAGTDLVLFRRRRHPATN